MKMPSMANELLHQLSEPAMEELSFEQRVGMMVDAEWLQKQLNRSKRLLRLAHLPQENATIEGIEYISGRDLSPAAEFPGSEGLSRSGPPRSPRYHPL